LQNWVARGINLPAQQHRIVFMDSVVTMFHKHAAPISELHRNSDAATWPEPIYILSALFPCWHIASLAIARENLAFFKMNMNGMIPATPRTQMEMRNITDCCGLLRPMSRSVPMELDKSLQLPSFTRALTNSVKKSVVLSFKVGSSLRQLFSFPTYYYQDW
jgi:hypothetical protein